MSQGLGRIGAVAITALFFLAALPVQATEVCRVAFSSGAVLTTSVARTTAAQAQGLSGTTGSLLFVWPAAEPRIFWMKDTPAPLDVAFIDAGGRVFDIQAMSVDRPEAALPIYYFSGAPAQYALELPAGEFGRVGIGIGDQLAGLTCTTPQGASD